LAVINDDIRTSTMANIVYFAKRLSFFLWLQALRGGGVGCLCYLEIN